MSCDAYYYTRRAKDDVIGALKRVDEKAGRRHSEVMDAFNRVVGALEENTQELKALRSLIEPKKFAERQS